MSKFWDQSWAKQSVVRTFEANDQWADAMAKALEDSPYKTPEGFDQTPCIAADGSFRMATCGPDYILLVRGSSRELVAELQQSVGRLTFYFICTRPQVRLRQSETSLTNGKATLCFEATDDDGQTWSETVTSVAGEGVQTLEVRKRGDLLVWVHNDGTEVSQDVALLAQRHLAANGPVPAFLNLEVRYIGRARGEVHKSCALDRLLAHEKYQKILEETAGSNRDVWLVLGSGTTVHLMAGSENPQPFDAARSADAATRSALPEELRVDLTEALLINYFKPEHNKQHVERLDLKGKALTRCRAAHLTGLVLAFDTDHLAVAMYTDTVPAKTFHAKRVCL